MSTDKIKETGTPFPDHKNQQGLKTSVREAKDLGIVYNNNNNNNNGFRVRFGVRRRHRGRPFALGYHQFVIIVAIQDEGEGEGGYTSWVGYSVYLSK